MRSSLFGFALLVICAQLVTASPAVDGARVGEWTMDLAAAKVLAADQKLPILLNFTGSDWCGWCKLMDKQVFSQAAWAEYATQALVTVWLDFPQDEALVPERYRERNQELNKQYDVEGYPTYVVLDSDGNTELGRLGAAREITPARFIQQVKDTLDNRSGAMEAMIADLGTERGAAFKEKTARLAAAREEQAKVEAEAMAALKKLTAEIESLEKDLDALRTDWKLSKLTDAQRTAYQAAAEAYQTQQEALAAWLQTEPERNEENQQKFTDLSQKLGELEEARNAALRGE